MKYRVTRPNTSIKIGKKTYKSNDVFTAKEERVKSLLKIKYIEEVKDGESINS